MALETRSGAYTQLQEYHNYGGKDFDSIHLSRFFNRDEPHDFGVMVTQMYSASDKFSYKPMLNMTEAAGRVFYIDGPLYKWRVMADDYKLATVVESVSGTRPGVNGEEFELILSEPWYSRGEVIMSDDPEVSLYVVADPIEKGMGFAYIVRLDGGAPMDYVDPNLLEQGRNFRSSSSATALELNEDYPGITWGSYIDLQSQTSAFARSFTMTDRAVVEQLNARDRGDVSNSDLFKGYTFPIYDSKTKKKIQDGGFMTFGESKVMDALKCDMENSMYWGRTGKMKDARGIDNIWRAPGWNQIVKDGHTLEHNGNLLADDFEDFFMGIMLNRNDRANRYVVVSTGTLGEKIFDIAVSQSASGFLTSLDSSGDSFIRNTGQGPGQLEYGFQFRRYVGKTGFVMELQHDPKKDSLQYDGRRYPYNQRYPIESATMDFFNVSTNGISAAPDKSNIAMVKLKRQSEYYWYTGAIDPKTGRPDSGQSIQNEGKITACRMADTGGLVVFDPSSIGQIRLRLDNYVYAS